MIVNPILKGFHPDPSIVRVGDDYYIATSTFEWFPGVMIYHSRDLKHWRCAARPLDSVDMLDMRGICSSGGVWAPCLTHDGKKFYLVYTNVTNRQIFYDTHNYLITAESINGPWSKPVYLDSVGFDPSMFHDDDGRKWLVSMISDPRKGKNKFGGIVIQEYDASKKCLVGEMKKIYKTSDEIVEGPHIYKHNGFYYLLLAHGGTGNGHGVLMLRSKSLFGPYEQDPAGIMLTSKFEPWHPLQKAGHADIVETQNGKWYMVHLVGRPIPSKGRCPLGRETAIERVEWKDGWLRLSHGGILPAIEVEEPGLEECKFPEMEPRQPWDSLVYQTLRRPMGEAQMSLSARPGWLRLYGKDGPTSKYDHAILARRRQDFICTATAKMDFSPCDYKHFAGLICIYDHENWYYLKKTCGDDGGMLLNVMSMVNGLFDESEPVEIPDGIIYLRAEFRYDELRFFYSFDEKTWFGIGKIYDCSTLSDEACREGAFTGTFIGVSASDMRSRCQHADFEWFEYKAK